ncbi:hypothetical protein ABW20_dc0108756 [Dactylellina cionopaga]|nr:hypothetical protein ABW20_dc0108756 [Dactylellina cionopaga]
MRRLSLLLSPKTALKNRKKGPELEATRKTGDGSLVCETKPERQPFRFLDLPRELRDEIYRYFVLLDFQRKPQLGSDIPEYKKPSLDLTILRANKQIHDEASGMLYGCNLFIIRVVLEDSYNVAYEAPWESLLECKLRGRYAYDPL